MAKPKSIGKNLLQVKLTNELFGGLKKIFGSTTKYLICLKVKSLTSFLGFQNFLKHFFLMTLTHPTPKKTQQTQQKATTHQ